MAASFAFSWSGVTARVVLLVGVMCVATAVGAQERRVDDEAVEPKLGIRAGAGFGVGVLTYSGGADSTRAVTGTGLSLEGSLGVGSGLEMGARAGLRLDDGGRGLRADEIGRGFETPTFGTGLSTVANPELRLRWRAVHRRWLEVGADEQVVLPTPSDRDVTEILGVWASAHWPGIARADIDVDGVLSWQSLAAGFVVVPALAAPVRLWWSPTRALFAGVVATPRFYGASHYTSSTSEMTVGLIAGYRFHACDADLGIYLLDVVNGGTDRTGAGVRVSCRAGRTSH